MKFDFTSLDPEPLWYFLTHSALFVTGLGSLFFLLGLWTGGLTWRRYKRQAQKREAEINSLKEEVAELKRTMTDVPSKSEVMPPPQEVLPPPPIVAAQAPVSETLTLPRSSQPVENDGVGGVAKALAPALPFLPELPEVLMPPQEFVRESDSLSWKSNRVPLLESELPGLTQYKEEDSVEPFSFLLEDEPEDMSKSQDTPPEDRAEEDLHGMTAGELLGIEPSVGFLLEEEEDAPPEVGHLLPPAGHDEKKAGA
jgi:hypothetical protein